jgi:hypothetical protein
MVQDMNGSDIRPGDRVWLPAIVISAHAYRDGNTVLCEYEMAEGEKASWHDSSRFLIDSTKAVLRLPSPEKSCAPGKCGHGRSPEDPPPHERPSPDR